jgi:5-oxoprolinase (ATP-hydrolysing)
MHPQRDVHLHPSKLGENPWAFWIDVGGTFTDCLARAPNGSVRVAKVLSSGRVKGTVHAPSDGSEGETSGDVAGGIEDPALAAFSDGFFRGYRVRLLDARGETRAEATVADSRAGRLELAEPIGPPPAPGERFELDGGEPAPLLAIRSLLGLRLDEPIGPVDVRLGTTRATNALLERRGARTAFVTTRGFGDILLIGNQNRPELFKLRIVKPAPLFEAAVEIDERASASGESIAAPDRAEVCRALGPLRDRGVESVAICLLNAYRSAEHERIVAVEARALGFRCVSVSSELSPTIKIVSRGDTTVADAYLTPVIREYVRAIAEAIPEGRLKLMTSAGGLVAAAATHGKDVILSGPAGGVVGLAGVARAAGIEKVIGFDMGGTSTDVSRHDGEFVYEYETQKAGVRIVAPMLAIETVAAGGGSICGFDGQKLTVGPRSAGADPGPACYGRGGPLAVTDVNLYLGRLPPDRFPFALDRDAVGRRMNETIDRLERSTGKRIDPVELAEGFVRIANASMAAAIEKISIARGVDVRDYALVSFGGAAGQHACAIARELGMRRVLVHPWAGVLSAYGLGVADVKKFAVRTVMAELNAERLGELEATFGEMERELKDQIRDEGVPDSRIAPPRRNLDLRYRGQSSTIAVVLSDVDAACGRIEASGSQESPSEESRRDSILSSRGSSLPAKPPVGNDPRSDPEGVEPPPVATPPSRPDVAASAEFERLHRRLYGHIYKGRAIEILAARVEMTGVMEKPDFPVVEEIERSPAPDSMREGCFGAAGRLAVAVFDRARLRPGDRIAGPAIVIEATGATVLDPGWNCRVTGRGDLLLEDRGGARREEIDAEANPIMLEVFNHRFAAIAEQMGVTLQRTSLSVNVKERLDFSCAVFTAGGDLVANAPHMPVHLGAMSETVKCVLRDFSRTTAEGGRATTLAPGDVVITNDPFRGGSHLPDITVVTPVFESQPEGAAPQRPIFFTASRAHHAELGGIRPGSMPPDSKNLAEEGVLIRNFKGVDRGEPRLDLLREILATAPYPSRAPDENVADVSAQIAANQSGALNLLATIDQFGRDTTLAYMGHIQRAAENKMRAALARLPDGDYEFEDAMDEGSRIKLKLTIQGETARLDFTGTAPPTASNLNANPAIVKAAVIYCFRCLIDEDIPLNDGVLAPIEIVLPECILNPPAHDDPRRCVAVVGGNVETSQRVTDVIFGALGLVAASQGTMNNLTFGNDRFGYYETICGGSGAGPSFHGTDAVHTHMTNTRLTDPEVLEAQFPVRLRRFEIRRGSGGAGRFNGGDGVRREIEFLAPLEVSLLTQRRSTQPYGLKGGAPGSAGRNKLIRRGPVGASPETIDLPGVATFQAVPGDRLLIDTPGGGGYGRSESSSHLPNGDDLA